MKLREKREYSYISEGKRTGGEERGLGEGGESGEGLEEEAGDIERLSESGVPSLITFLITVRQNHEQQQETVKQTPATISQISMSEGKEEGLVEAEDFLFLILVLT